MEEITVTIEVEGGLEQSDRFGIEDAIYDALHKLGIAVVKVRVG